jgi:hypothetical protein
LPSTDPSTGSGQASGVAGYKVYRNGVQIATTTGTSYLDNGLSPATTYTYRVSAYDGTGNVSAQSGPVSATTQTVPVSDDNTDGDLKYASTVMPSPTSTDSFIYTPSAVPFNSTNPSMAKPIGVGSVATGGDTVSLHVALNQHEGAVDVYLGIYAPSINPDIHIIKPDLTLQPISMGLVPWRANTNRPINEDLFGAISRLPAATYYLYIAVTKAGSQTTYYLWTTHFIIP